MCYREPDSLEEPGAEVICGDAIESYEKLDQIQEEFEPILKMIYGRIAYNEKDILECVDNIAELLGMKSYNIPGVINA